MISEAQVEEALWWLKDEVDSMAQARANRLYLELFMKSKQSMLRKESNETSEHKRTDYALTHADYLEVLEGYKSAVKADEKKRFQRDANIKLIDAWQTMSANARKSI